MGLFSKKSATIKGDLEAQQLCALFEKVKNADLKKSKLANADSLARWYFADLLTARNERLPMNFHGYDGPAHLEKFFNWIRGFKYNDPFEGDTLSEKLIEESRKNDVKVFEFYNLRVDKAAILQIARYNMQDFRFQRAYAVPERHKIRTLLDFGAGHGRIANLSFNANEQAIRKLIVVEAIPSTYFTQLAYYKGLGLKVWEYLDHWQDGVTPQVISDALQKYDVVHLPTWMFDCIPEGCVDMVNCIQVLKELPGDLVPVVIKHFARVVHSCGALYIRDHIQFHNPNQMPIDTLIEAAGFKIEFAPHYKDRVDVHGVPRIWRKVDPDLFLQDRPR